MSQKKFIILILAFSLFFLPRVASLYASESEEEILNALEGFFISLKEKQFADAWDTLTSKSKNTIINEVYKEVNKKETRVGREVIKQDFDTNGELLKAYWTSFLQNFDPDSVLKQSVWNIGKIEKNTAVIVLQHKKSEYPAEMKLYRENGKWKVGLIETFWTRK